MGGTGSKAKYEIVIVGLDNAGKTTILQQMKNQLQLTSEDINTIPTIGCNEDHVSHNRVKLKVTDMGGKESNRSLWEPNYKTANGIIFVIDSSDVDRLNEVREEVQKILNDKDIPEDCCLLFFGNKQDVKGALDINELKKRVGLTDDCTKRHWHIEGSVATEATGVKAGLDWLVNELKGKKQKKKD